MKLRFALNAFIVLLLVTATSFNKQQPTIPRYDHVIIIMEENHGFNELIGSANAPYMNELAKQGALFTQSHGIAHPSQPNYLALYSGGTQGVLDDACLQQTTPYTTPNLGASLISHGFSFKGYAQTMPSEGFLDCVYTKSASTAGYLYARKHAPWVNWQGTKANNIPASCSQPMTAFPSDFTKLPTLSFVIPDMDYDMHNIGAPGDAAAIQRGDKWLKENIDAYVQWAKTHNSLLIVTFDEDDYKTMNQIPTMFIGANVTPGKYDEKIDHYNLLHTLEAMYGLPTIAADAQAAVITDVWKK
jgi:hypothetical protein